VRKVFFVLTLFFSLSGFAKSKVRDLGVEGLSRATCGALATAMTERVYNTNKESGKEVYLTPVFKKDVDFEMMRNLKKLATDSETFTDGTPDTERIKPLHTAFNLLSKRRFRYAKECLQVYRPPTRKCFHHYQVSGKASVDTCVRELVDKAQEARFIKKFFLRDKN
jgi:hypothetical protein